MFGRSLTKRRTINFWVVLDQLEELEVLGNRTINWFEQVKSKDRLSQEILIKRKYCIIRFDKNCDRKYIRVGSKLCMNIQVLHN